MKKMLVYPFHKDISVIARYLDLIKQYDVSYFVAPKGWGYDGKDIDTCDGGSKTGLNVVSDFKKSLQKSDIVFLNYYNTTLSVNHYIDIINLVIDANKELIITETLKDYLQPSFIIPENIRILHYDNKALKTNGTKLYSIPVPVILVAGAGMNCNKFDIQLMLGKYFKLDNYKTLQIGTKEYSELFGVRPLPKYLFEDMKLTDKIISFNHYVYDIVKAENPDIVIVGIPGGIMPLNPLRFDEFGEYAYIVCNAIKADIGILSIYQGIYQTEFFDEIRKLCQYKLNMPIDYINISNTEFKISTESFDTGTVYITTKSENVITEIIPEIKYEDAFIFQIFDQLRMKDLYKRIVNKLIQNI